MPERSRIVLVDDHALIRDSLGQVLGSDPDIQVVGTATNGEEAVEITLALRPSIVLMDIHMPGISCFDAASRIMVLRPATRIVFVTAFVSDRYIEEALRVNARGFLTKTEPVAQLVAAVKQVAAGKVYFSPDVRSRIVADTTGVRLASRGRTRLASLSPRELDVLLYLARGMAKKEIAHTMHISVKTVEGHTQKLMTKLDVHDRVELARLAIREGLCLP